MKTRLALLVGFAVAMGGGQILSAATAYAPVAVPKSNTKKLYVHDEANDAKPGDRVRVQETRPLSKLKRWRLVEVLERAR